MSEAVARCPIDHSKSAPHSAQRDDRKSAAIAALHAKPYEGAILARTLSFARDVLRAPTMRQASAGAEQFIFDNPDHASIFVLDGDVHRKRRAQLGRFFSPKMIRERHLRVIERTTQELITQLQNSGRERLDIMCFELASDVVAEIVGLTESKPRELSARILKTFSRIGGAFGKGFAQFASTSCRLFHAGSFYWHDVRPAVAARRIAPKDDVISHMVQENYSSKAMLLECMTYAVAGMLTTREFMVMAAWHLFDNADLRQQFLNGDENLQLSILDEILRLEPAAGYVFRRATTPMIGSTGEKVQQGDLYGIDIRTINTDPAIAGECPFAIDPDRTKRMKMPAAGMSFGDGAHRCPGSLLAMQETRIFLNALLRVPGIRLDTPPSVGWCEPVMGYELSGAVVTCDQV